jgi:hypothetical protein
MRYRIADIIDEHDGEMTCYVLADIIMDALPDMIAPLVWSKSVIKGWDGDYHTVPTLYKIRCADENGWKLSYSGGFGYYHGPEQAKDAANAHHRAAIMAAFK